MSIIKRATTGAALALLAGLTLSGCITIESAPPSADEAPASSTAPVPEESVTPSEEPSSAATEEPTEDADTSEADATGKTVNVTGDADGTVYVRAIQAFSPLIETWIVNEDEHTVTYSQHNCVGATKREGTGTYQLAGREGDQYTEVTWDGENPNGGISATDRFDMTDTTLEPRNSLGDQVASTDTDAVLADYTVMCQDVGETIAGFVF